MIKSQNINKPLGYSIALTRISLGLIFFWAFIDKLWGLGFATCRDPETSAINVMCDSAWLSGGSPTSGFLQFATSGPFADFFNSLAGIAVVDWLFMLGLLLIGLSLLTGIGVVVASVSGALMMLFMWLAVLPPSHHPFVDDHVVYIFALGAVMYANDSQKLGLGEWWSKQPLVKKRKWLR